MKSKPLMSRARSAMSLNPAAYPTSRFTQWMPTVSRFVQHTWLTLVFAIGISSLLLLVSVHWALMPLCVWVVLVGLKIDWALLDRMAIPPLVILILLPAIGMGLGIPLFVGTLDIGLSPLHLIMQLVFLLGAPFLFVGYRLGRGSIRNNWCPPDTERIFDTEAKPLMTVAYFFLVFDIIRITIGWRSGSLDRGYAGEALLDQQMGVWTFAGIFGRWNNLWFFFLPLLWRKGSLLLRALVAASLGYYVLIAFGSGSRGLLIYPFIFVVCGLYFFVDKPRFRPERWAPVAIIFVIIYIYALDVFRNTAQFQNSKLTDLSARLAATSAIAEEAKERQDFSLTMGRALIAVSDELIYELTPDTIPYAGAGDILPALPWTWVPHALAPNKPIIWDNNEVVVSYTNSRNERSFAAISLSADLYRRFGWAGIPVGLFLVGVLYGALVRGIIAVYRWNSVVIGVTLIAFLTGGLQSVFTSTVLQTWWIWAYDLPKHLIPLTMVVYIIGGGVGRGLSKSMAVTRRTP
jgi:hypothetical protein